jgi:hypothetical protein
VAIFRLTEGVKAGYGRRADREGGEGDWNYLLGVNFGIELWREENRR